jgi:hypothetical protein
VSAGFLSFAVKRNGLLEIPIIYGYQVVAYSRLFYLHSQRFAGYALFSASRNDGGGQAGMAAMPKFPRSYTG